MDSKPFRRYEAGELHPLTVKAHSSVSEPFEDPDAVVIPTPVEALRDVPPCFEQFAAGAVERLETTLQPKYVQFDPALLLLLARLVAEIFLACTAAKVTTKLTRIQQFPYGLLARRVHREIVQRLPDSIIEQSERDQVAKALLDHAVANIAAVPTFYPNTPV